MTAPAYPIAYSDMDEAAGHKVQSTNDTARLQLENRQLRRQLETMAAEIQWLKRLHDKELEFRERELVLRERQESARLAPQSAAATAAPLPGPDRRTARPSSPTPVAEDQDAVLNATLGGDREAGADTPLPDLPTFLVDQPKKKPTPPVKLKPKSTRLCGWTDLVR